MNFIVQPCQLLLIILAGWINRHQQRVVEYLRTENQVLKEIHGSRRILLSDDQRRRLALKGKALGRKALQEVATIVTPDTILRWHRQLIAQKWDCSARRHGKLGRPQVSKKVTERVRQMAGENPTWGYDRIQGALANLGHELSDTTVGNILKAHGIEPAPGRKRQTTWKTFLKSHWLRDKGIDPDHDVIPDGFDEPISKLEEFRAQLQRAQFDPETEELCRYMVTGGSLSTHGGLAVVRNGDIVAVVNCWESQ